MEEGDILAGIGVVEMASMVYVPSAAAIMADDGAEVIRRELLEGLGYGEEEIADLMSDGVVV